LQLLQEELSGNRQSQADFIQLGQSLTSDTRLDSSLTEHVSRQMLEARDTADRLQTTLSELESSLTSLVDTTRRFDNDLATLSTTVTSLTDQLMHLPTAVGYHPAWFTQQNSLIRVCVCFFTFIVFAVYMLL